MPFTKLYQVKMSTTVTDLSEEEQHFYNHHIIENFVESVREMNDVVLIPSKLKDLDPNPPKTTSSMVSSINSVNGNSTTKISATLNDDLYSYYQMINVVKNDLFEPHTDFDLKNIFQMPKRKISRHQRHTNHQQQNGGSACNGNGLSNSRSVSISNLSSLMMNGNCLNGNHTTNGNNVSNGSHSPLQSDYVNNEISNTTTTASHLNGSEFTDGTQQQRRQNGQLIVPPLSSEQLIGQNAKQLTLQFIHHLHSLYTILEHFTHAADFITERYINEFEQSTM